MKKQELINDLFELRVMDNTTGAIFCYYVAAQDIIGVNEAFETMYNDNDYHIIFIKKIGYQERFDNHKIFNKVEK